MPILLDNAVAEIARLPGIGRRTAMRLALHLLRREEAEVEALAGALTALRREAKYCRVCHNLSDTELCPVCADHRRDRGMICVVESIEDVMAIERTQQYRGLYHVLGGVISPMEGIGPADIEIDSLVERVEQSPEGGLEVIFALASTMEGDTTSFYISRRLGHIKGLKMSVIARGISVGDELQYADELTLGRAVVGRRPLE